MFQSRVKNKHSEDKIFEKIKAGCYEEALTEFSKLPTTDNTIIGKAKCYIKLGANEEAIKLLQPLCTKLKKTGTITSKIATLLATAYAQNKQYDKALDALSLSPNPNTPEVRYAKISYLAYSNVEESLKLFESIPKTAANEVYLIELKGNIFYNSGQVLKTKSHYQACLNKLPYDFALKSVYAAFLLQIGELEEARSEILQCTTQEPSNRKYQQLLRRINWAIQQGDKLHHNIDNAEEQAQNLLKDLKNNLFIRVQYSLLIHTNLMESNKPALSIKLMQALLEKYPLCIEYQMAYLDAILAANQFENIIQQVEILLTLKELLPSKKVHISVVLEKAYKQTHNFIFLEYAEKILRELIDNYPDLVEPVLSLARILETQKLFPKARELLSKVITTHRDLWSEYLNYAVLCDLDDDQEAGIAVLDKLCTAYKDHQNNIGHRPTQEEYSKALVTLSILHFEKDPASSLAKTMAELAVKVSPESDSAWSQLGHCEKDANKRTFCFNKARELRPQRLFELHPTPTTENKLSNPIAFIEIQPAKPIPTKSISPVINPWNVNGKKGTSNPSPALSAKDFPSLSEAKSKKLITKTSDAFFNKEKTSSLNAHAKPFLPSNEKCTALNPNAKPFEPLNL